MFKAHKSLDPNTRLKIIKNFEARIIKLQRRVNKLKETCTHQWFKSKGGCAKCLGCGTFSGWWCEKSPDKQCAYDQEDGSYNEDSCVYCGLPMERK